MDRLQERMVSEIDRFSPEALLNQWLSAIPQNVERTQKLFADMFLGGSGQGKRNASSWSGRRQLQPTRPRLKLPSASLLWQAPSPLRLNLRGGFQNWRRGVLQPGRCMRLCSSDWMMKPRRS